MPLPNGALDGALDSVLDDSLNGVLDDKLDGIVNSVVDGLVDGVIDMWIMSKSGWRTSAWQSWSGYGRHRQRWSDRCAVHTLGLISQYLIIVNTTTNSITK